MSCCCAEPKKVLTEPAEEFLQTPPKEWLKVGLAAVIAAQAMAWDLALNITPAEGNAPIIIHWVLAASTVLVFLLIGLPLARQAFDQLRKGRIVIEQFFLIGIIGAFAGSLQSTIMGVGGVYYEVVAVLLAIYTVGKMIREQQRKKTFKSISSLRQEFESCMKISENGELVKIKIDQITAGDFIYVEKGQAIAVDGIVADGVAFVRETPLTGEPFPIVKRPGDHVMAGSRALDHALTIEATAAGQTRHLDKIFDTVEKARQAPTSLQYEADKIVKIFLPAVLVISVLTFCYWITKAHWSIALFNSLAVLIVACPCAMGLATPIGVWTGLSSMAQLGLRVRSGDFIERLAKVNHVVFDKTGTLSKEELQLVDFVCADESQRAQLQKWIAAMQSKSDHPIAKAFQNWGVFQDAVSQVNHFEILAGCGIQAQITSKGETYLLQIGNSDLLENKQEAQPLLDRLVHQRVSHFIYVKLDKKLVAVGALQESLKESADETFSELKKNGIQFEVMSGDRQESLTQLGIQDGKGGLLPDQKRDLIKNYQQRGDYVLFVGDGINDSPALSEAYASISISTGADISHEVSHATLYGNHLTTITESIKIARKVIKTIRQNLIFAACYNSIGIGIAASGYLHPILAAVMMLGSSIFVSWRATNCHHEIEESIHQTV
jgi:heavy metal translocating P-type ATPase